MTHRGPYLSATLRAGIVDARLELPATTVAVLGPNASGKTTLLRAVAGLLPNEGAVVVAGHDVSRLPPSRRRVGYVPQHVALFGHLDVRDNVAYGVRAGGHRRAEARRVAAGWLDRLGIGDLAARRPGQLSGGQAQRVALARALATDPQVLLLDEPLSALDVSARTAVRSELREHLGSFAGTSLVVSHDPADAWALAEHVVVLEDGRVVQRGRLAEVAERPASAWLAQLLGLNAWPGTVAGSTVHLATGTGEVELAVAGDHSPARVTVTVPPSKVRLELVDPHAPPAGWCGRVSGVERHGDRLLVHVASAVGVRAEVPTAAALAGSLRAGLEVGIRVPPEALTVARTGDRDTLG